MTRSSLLLLAALGVFVPTAAVDILGQDYDITIAKSYMTDAPSNIEVEGHGRNFKVKVYIKGVGYNLGYTFEKDPMEKIVGYRPTIQKKFVDMFGNKVECENGRTELVVRKEREEERYLVLTENATYSLMCLGDYKKSKAFIIGSKSKNATMGQLYVLDTKNYEIIKNHTVSSQAIPEVGSRITAVAIRSSNGVIFLSDDVAGQKTFNIVALTPLNTTEGSGIYNPKNGSNFMNAVNRTQEGITELLNINFENRTSELAADNEKLRQLLEKEYYKINGSREELPPRGKVFNASLDALNDLKATIKDMGDELIRLYFDHVLGFDEKTKKYYIMGNKTRERGIVPRPKLVSAADACWFVARSFLAKNKSYSCELKRKFKDREALLVATEKVFLEIAEWALNVTLELTRDDTRTILGPQAKELNLFSRTYEVNVLKNYESEAPRFIEYKRNIIVFIKGQAYNLGANLEYSLETVPLRGYEPEIKNNFTDINGNFVECIGGKSNFTDVETGEKYEIKAGKYTLQCFGDDLRHRVFIIGGDKPKATNGKLYALNTQEVDIINGKVVPLEITQVGDGMTAVTVHKSDGRIMLTQELTRSGKTSFNVILLKPIDQEPLIKSDAPVAIEDNQNTFSIFDKDENEFINTVREARYEILEIQKRKWLSGAAQLLEEHDRLRSLSNKLNNYFLQNNQSYARNKSMQIFSVEKDSVLHSSFNHHLKVAIQEKENELFRIYIKDKELIDSKFKLILLTQDMCSEKKRKLYSCTLTDEWGRREVFYRTIRKIFEFVTHLDLQKFS